MTPCVTSSAARPTAATPGGWDGTAAERSRALVALAIGTSAVFSVIYGLLTLTTQVIA